VGEIVDLLARHLAGGDASRIAALYQFGSTVAGRARPDSDVDLAFLGPPGLDPVQVFAASGAIATLLDRDVDLVDLEQATTVMRVQVVGPGQRLHTGDPVRVAEFEMYALSDFARLEEERRPVIEAFLARYRD
jgi:predicted nucleotidyltransferase